MRTVCVFTPTYDRAYTLRRLYESLEKQTCQDFVWRVVDDGSTDNTEELINEFVQEKIISIYYVKVNNGGKQRAQDLAVSLSKEELFFTVDSDDYLADDAIQLITSQWSQLQSSNRIAGLIALKGFDETTPLGTWMPKGVEISRLRDLYRKGLKGDTSLIYRTDVLKRFPFDVEPGEKFIPESYVYNQIDAKYTCGVINEVLTICEYLPDGYSSSFPRNVIDNPKSYYKHKKLCMDLSEGVFDNVTSTIMFQIASRLCGRGDTIKCSKNKIVALLTYIPSFFLYKIYFHK